MTDGQGKVFFLCDTGEWAYGDDEQFARSAAATGTRIKLVVAPMAFGEFCRRLPNLAARMAGDCTFVRGAPEWACQTKNMKLVEVDGRRVAIPDHEADRRCAEDFGICIGPLSAAMTPEQVAEWFAGAKKTAINLDIGPSAPGVAEKLDRMSEVAHALQARMDAPGYEVHRLQAELADLRAKLRYASVRVPEGFYQVEGLASSVKGRETPGHQDRAAYLDGVRVPHTTDALPGPHGFIIAGRDRAVFNGVVHVFEMDPGRARQPWPAELTFSVKV